MWRRKLKSVPLIAAANAAFRVRQQEARAARGLEEYRRRAAIQGPGAPPTPGSGQ